MTTTPLFVKDLTRFTKDEQEFFISTTNIRIDQIIENRFRELEAENSFSETFQILDLIQSFIENKKLAFDIIQKLFFLKWQIIVSLLESDNSNAPDINKLEESLRDLSRSFSFFDVRNQLFLLMRENWTSEQVQKLVKNPSTSNPIQSFIENEGLRLDIRKRLLFLKWWIISLFKEDNPNVLDPGKLEAFLRDLNRFNVNTQAHIIIGVLEKKTPKQQVQELMKNPSISNLIQSFIENKKIDLDYRDSLFLLKHKAIPLFKEDDPNVLDPGTFKAFLRDFSRFDVEAQAYLIIAASLRLKWTPGQVQELMKNPSISNFIQNSIENKKLGLFIRKDLFFFKWEAISLFKEDSPNVLDPNKFKAFLRGLSRFDVETQGSLIKLVLSKWTWTPEQIQELMKNPSISNLIQSFIENKKIDLFTRQDLFSFKWKAISLFKENDPNVLDPGKFKAFLRDLSHFDVEAQAFLIKRVSLKLKWTPKQVQELMKNPSISNLIQNSIENKKIGPFN